MIQVNDDEDRRTPEKAGNEDFILVWIDNIAVYRRRGDALHETGFGSWNSGYEQLEARF